MSEATAVTIYGPDGVPVRARAGMERRERARAMERRVMTVASDILRERMSQLAGLQYGDKRDVYKVAGYPNEYRFEEGWSRYRRQGIARRLVDLPAQRTWRKRPEVSVGEAGEDSEFVDEWTALWDRVGMARTCERVDRLASIGKYALLYMAFGDVTADQELKRPVEGLEGPDDLIGVRAFKQSDVTLGDEVEDHRDPDHGKPAFYKINFGTKKGQDNEQLRVKVHRSRVIHVVEDPLDNDVEGLPRLERAINRLIDLEKLPAATAEAFWQLAVKILAISVDPDASLTDTQWDDLDDEFEEIVHDLRRHFMGQGIEMDFIGGDEPDPSGAGDFILTLLTASYGIPKRVFLGTETGERASQQDERAFLGLIGDRIEQYAEPTIVRPWTDRLVEFGVLPDPGEPYSLHWPPLKELDEMDEAEIDKARAEVASALTPVGGDPKRFVEITEEGRIRLIPDVEREEIEAGGDEADEIANRALALVLPEAENGYVGELRNAQTADEVEAILERHGASSKRVDFGLEVWRATRAILTEAPE